MVKPNKIFKPKIKKFVNSKLPIYNENKLLSLKKKKWNKYVNYFSKLNKLKKNNCYYKFYDQRSYNVSRFLNKFKNSFRVNLSEKRRFKLLYGNLKVNYIKKLVNYSFLQSKFDLKTSNIKNHFICLLESRLDIILLKSYFAINIRNARQLIAHGNIKVNNKIVKNNSLILKVGDKITVTQNAQALLEYRLINNCIWTLPPKYLQIDYKIFQIIIVSNPINNNLSNNFSSKINFDVVLHSYEI